MLSKTVFRPILPTLSSIRLISFHFARRSVHYYTKSHEYVLPISEKKARIGISSVAAEKLGEVVFVDVSSVGKSIKLGEDLATLESVKAVGEVYSPVSGTIVRANPAAVKNDSDGLSLVNKDPEGEGWLAEIEVESESDLTPESNEHLMTRGTYLEQCEHDHPNDE